LIQLAQEQAQIHSGQAHFQGHHSIHWRPSQQEG
jgi:hypothetical protein